MRTASDLNHFLTRLVFYTALVLQTFSSVKNEVTIAHDFREWQELLRQTVPDACGQPPEGGLNYVNYNAASQTAMQCKGASGLGKPG